MSFLVNVCSCFDNDFLKGKLQVQESCSQSKCLTINPERQLLPGKERLTLLYFVGNLIFLQDAIHIIPTCVGVILVKS